MKADAFATMLQTALNHGALSLMMSIRHRTGLFDTMDALPPSTSAEIASAANLNERYVREWLAAMVTARVVELHPETSRYVLPPEHAAVLTRAAGPQNMTVISQFFAGLGSVEDEIVQCFRKGGGVPYSRFPRFHEVMAEDSNQSVLSSLEGHVLPLVPGLTDALKRGIRVLDVGCGRGLIMIRLAELYPRSRMVAMDLSEEAIAFARDEAARRKLTNTEFVVRDMSDFDATAERDVFDVITTFDAIHDQARPLNVLRGIHRALKPAGVYLMQDINGTGRLHEDVEHPFGTLLYTISCLH